MSKASPILENFNTGELSPLIAGRTGFDKYPNGASLLENFIPTVQGPNKRRAGFRFVSEVKSSALKVLLVPFEFSVTQAYMLEFGHLYVRFYTWDAVTKVRGMLESSPGVPAEVATPYTESDLYNTDGTPRLQFTQSGDFLYLAHPGYQQRILKRLSMTSFSLDLFEAKGGPWQALNETDTTVYASAETGAGITLTASTAIFAAGHVGALFYLESRDVNAITAWEVGQDITAGKRRRSDGKTYEALTAGRTGTNRPVHTEGAQFDGGEAQAQVGTIGAADYKAPVPVSVQWEYRDAGSGYVRITGFTSATVVTAAVIDRLPSEVVGVGKPTKRWAAGEWSSVSGWPSSVALYRERLWWARKMMVWGSVAADYSDYAPKSFGQVTADMAIRVQMASGKINDVQWLAPDRDLVAGTAGGEFAIGELSNGEPLGPANVRARLLSGYGSRAISPIKNGESLLFIQRAGRKARETFYDFTSDGYKSSDTTVLAEHITKSGVLQMTFAQEPDQIVWCLRADGKLIGFTWNNEQSVRGWHRHPMGGAGFVESIAVMPAAEGDRSELWAVVRRTINGVTRRYVEYMERAYSDEATQASQFYVDSGLSYAGAATTTISGLGHLEGMEVSVLVNGAPHPNRTVTAGAITLQIPATTAQVGLPCPARYRSMRLEAGARDGTSQGKTKRISKVVLRLQDTGGGRYGPLNPGGFMDPLLLRQGNAAMDLPAPLFTGDAIVSWPDGYNTDAFLGFEIDQPVAATLVALMPQITTQDAR